MTKKIPKMKPAALKELMMLAEQGIKVHQAQLGLYYRQQANWEEAFFWLSLASGAALLQALQETKNHLSAEQVSEIKKRLKEWRPIPV
ncbi:MAG: hypothetical protein EPN97_01145 [Alphaproteobacteria bacterium]|nr:MAG: hypothetical protein EPN97_01145 [Alphaproteobacteria bacterium]